MKNMKILLLILLIATIAAFSFCTSNTSSAQSNPSSPFATTAATTTVDNILDTRVAPTTTVPVDTTTVPPAPDTAQYSVYFCPEDKCSTHVIDAIDNARTYVHVAMYDFTLKSIADALIRAKDRGVDVMVVIESDDVKGSEYDRLKNAGVDIRLDGNPALMHNKFMVIDDILVETGSFNWTFSADTKNNENLIFLRSEALADSYETDFKKIYDAGS